MISNVPDRGMYIIDNNYRILYINQVAKDMYPGFRTGDLCHKALHNSDKPCTVCPVDKKGISFFSHYHKRWISAYAAEMELPEYGMCYNIQLQPEENSYNSRNKQMQERLREREVEAIQLLAAINATYDMIVSVNLTQNTYRLLGEESFVTHGDNITGVFDDVINIHYSKVVSRHKEAYFNTFSREALLKAHSEGKKSVYLEYQQYGDDGIPHWLGTHTMFTENPYSSDVTEITISKNIDEQIYKEEQNKAALEKAINQANQANQAKSNFLSAMSHDIRTPMNAIVGFTHLALKENDFSVVKENYLPKIQTSGEHLLMLINDILEMSRIESGKIELKTAPYHIGEISMSISQVVESLAKEKKINLVNECNITDYYIYCDKLRIHQIITNILSNAVKFTAEHGTISVTVKQENCDEQGYSIYEFNISDTGIGMSEEFLKNVFNPFEREKTSTVTRLEGTGLGLSIVKNLVDAMGGTISITSQINVGTNVKIRIKFRLVEPEKIVKTSEEDMLVQINIEEIRSHFNGKRLLVAEDNELNLMITENILTEAGFIVETAEDGIYAVDMVKNAPTDDYYDAVLMDIQMPVMDGYEATQAIRSLESERRNVKIIAATANAFESDVQAALKVGMNAHISKPIDIDELYRVLLREIVMNRQTVTPLTENNK